MKLKSFFKKKLTYKPVKMQCRISNKSTYVIHHYCPHTYNAGDHFVILSIRKHLKKYLPNSIFIPKPVAGNRGWGKPIGLKEENIFFSNKYADAVIVGGSDQYNNWSPKIDAQEIQELIPPLFLIGLGVSSSDLYKKPKINNPKYYNDILKTNEKSMLSSVRDDVTKDFLKDLGYNRAIVTGCPALFLYERELHLDESKNILLTFPYPLLHNDNDEKYKILNNLINGIIKYIKEKNLNPIIVCHDDRDVPKAQELFSQYDIFYSNYPEDYLSLYSSAKFLIGSRLHATIVSAGLGIPSININLDLRGIGFSKTFELSEWNLNYDNKNILQDVKDRIDSLLNNDLTAFSKFIDKREKYKIIFNDFMKDVAEKIKKGE